MKSIVLLVFGVLSLFASPLGAQTTEEKAKAAFDEGTKYYKAENYLSAVEAFRRAYKLRPNWKLLYNIAQSEASANRHGTALQAFERYLADGGDQVPQGRMEEEVRGSGTTTCSFE